MTLLDAALALHDHGLAVLPVRTDGTKAPARDWKDHQSEPPSPDALRAWFANDAYDGLGVITGAVSGNLEMFEVEGRAGHLVAELAALMVDNGFGDLWKRLCTGYLEQSPSGGLHWLYRVDGPANRNTKIARRPATDEELSAHQARERASAARIDNYGQREERLRRIAALTPEQVPQVLIETRGEGGFTVTAPSAGRTHATGRPWLAVAGSPGQMPTLTIDERDALYAIASLLDTMPEVGEPGATPRTTATSSTPRPGDEFNARANWDDILIPHGWQRTKKFGGNCWGWTRPGKSARDGISATTGRNEADNLFVFSSSTEFQTERAYSKFAAYALLEHHGDYSTAAKALRGDGYGKPAEEARPKLTIVGSEKGPTADSPSSPSSYSLTDDGNALRLIDTHGGILRYCPEAGAWLRWDSHRWAWDTPGHIHELAREIARDLPDTEKVDSAHRKKSLSSMGLRAMVNVAKTDTRIIVSPDRLDGRPYELNTPAGVVDLGSGELRSPDPAALHTRSTPVSPDFNADAPRWAKFLADTFAGDPELTTYIQRLLGLSLIGEHLEQILPFGWGSGANGKSTLMNVTQGVIGTGHEGYSIPAPAELLLASHNRSHPTELARLSGARLVVASELEDGERFAESRIKMLTGGENIAARFMGKDFFSFKPTHTIWLLANDQPAVRAGGPAFWRRLRLLPFIHVVPPADRITGLDHQLIDAEGPAILAWLIRGAMNYLRHGLAEPASVRVATASYERDQDTVARFVEECCATGPQGAQHMSVRVAELRQSYEQWCRIEGETPVSSKALTGALTSRFGVAAVRSKSARFYAGVRLTDVSPEPVTDEPDGWWQR